MPIRVLIAECETVYRAGLRTLLEEAPEILVVGEAEDGAGVIKARRLWETDVLLLDSGLPGPPNPRGIVRMLEDAARTNILIIAMLADRWGVQDLLKLGAQGCILKESTGDALIKAVQTVASGERYVDPELTVRLADEHAAGEDGDEVRHFTSQEEDMCKLLVSGFTHLEIAEKLGLSEGAVEAQRRDIMTKLGLRSRADLVHFAQSHGLWREW